MACRNFHLVRIGVVLLGLLLVNPVARQEHLEAHLAGCRHRPNRTTECPTQSISYSIKRFLKKHFLLDIMPFQLAHLTGLEKCCRIRFFPGSNGHDLALLLKKCF